MSTREPSPTTALPRRPRCGWRVTSSAWKKPRSKAPWPADDVAATRLAEDAGTKVSPMPSTIPAAVPKMNVPLLDLRQQYATIRAPVRAAIDAVCDSQALILGKTTEDFEKRLAEYCGTKHAIGLSSGTDALLAVFMAMDLKPGDEIICPSFTFFATAGCIHRAGAKAVFVDIEADTFNLDPEKVAAAITPR